MSWGRDVHLMFPKHLWRPECHVEPSTRIVSFGPATPPSFTGRKRAPELLIHPSVQGLPQRPGAHGCARRRVSGLSPAGQEPRLRERGEK